MDGRREHTGAPVLGALLSGLVLTVPGAAMGCLSSAAPVRLSLHTDERAAAIDAGQLREGSGPRVEVARTRRAVHADVTQVRICWPRFARAAREAHVFSFLIVPLTGSPQLDGAVSLYGGRSHAFTDADVTTALRAVAGIRRELLGLAADRTPRRR